MDLISPPVRELVTLAGAARRVGRRRSTLQRWVERGLLHRVGIDSAGRDVYDLARVRAVASASTSRARGGS